MTEATADPAITGAEATTRVVWRKQLQALKADNPGFSVYLVNGIKLQFKRIAEFDDVCFEAVTPDGGRQVILLTAVSTLVPAAAKSQR